MRIVEISPSPALDAEGLRSFLRNGPASSAVAQLLPGLASTQLAVERVHFPDSRPVQLQIRAYGADGQNRVLLGEWFGSSAAEKASSENARLAKPRRGQWAGNPALVADTETGLVLRRPGFDAKLPGLRLLHDPDWAAERLAAIGLDPASEVTLVAHRLGKRAVLRIKGAEGTHYARLRPVTSSSGQQAYDRHVALWASLQGNRVLCIPRPLGFEVDIGLALFDNLPGISPRFQQLDGFRATAAVMTAIGALQSLMLQAPLHRPTDELAILDVWAKRVAWAFPDMAQRLAEPYSDLRQQMSALAPRDAVLCHRDLHEGQILLHQGQVGLLDFDTLRLGDPALDVGNLQAHLILASLRDGLPRRAFVTAMENALPQLSLQRIGLWRRAALLRLAMIYAFSAEPRATILALIQEAT